MRILSLEVEYPVSGWKLERMEFGQLNLLVGVSGVGKTRILQALMDIQELAQSSILGNQSANDPPSINWEIAFESYGESFVWTGNWNGKAMLHETLTCENEILIKREGTDWILEGAKIPSGQVQGSLLRFYATDEHPKVQHAQWFFFGIEVLKGKAKDPNPLYPSWVAMEAIQLAEKSSDLSPRDSIDSLAALAVWFPLRLSLYKSAITPSIKSAFFDPLVSEFQTIFPQVKGIKLFKAVGEYSHTQKEQLFEIRLELEEEGFDAPLPFEDWSAGMQQVFAILVKLKINHFGRIFLIDEFENSLGVNCIHAVMDSILSAQRDHQFIITSHHPYIINAVPFKHWKVITRKGSTVSAHTADEFGLGKSKHEAFMQLINLEAFTEGIS